MFEVQATFTVLQLHFSPGRRMRKHKIRLSESRPDPKIVKGFPQAVDRGVRSDCPGQDVGLVENSQHVRTKSRCRSQLRRSPR